MSLRTRLQRFLGEAAAKTLQREKPFVIAITGSVGKSSTKAMIAAALQADGSGGMIRASKKNYNNELGLPLTIFHCDAPGRSIFSWLGLLWRAWIVSIGWARTGVQTFVLEMGADKPGDLSYLTSIAQPDISVITAVTPEDSSWAPVHAANYPSIDALAREKEMVVRATKADGIAILNADDPRVLAMRSAAPCHTMLFGESLGADVRLVGTCIRVEEGKYGNMPKGLEVRIDYFNHHKTFFFPGVFGRPIAYAACAAIAVAVTMDLGEEAIDQLATHYEPLPSRTRIVPGVKYTTVLDDTYNASPVAVLSAIRDLASMPLQEHQRRIACLGEMRELGEQARVLHWRVGMEAARQSLDLLVACGTFASALAEGAREGGMREDQIIVVNDTPQAGLLIQDWIKPGDVVLVKASQGPEPHVKGFGSVTGVRMERVVKELMADPEQAELLLCRQSGTWITASSFNGWLGGTRSRSA